MNKIKLLFIFLQVLYPLEQAHSGISSGQILFQQISLRDGLSQSTVYDIKQDKLGYLWVATADGLNRYDSYKFTVYRNNQDDSLSLPSNFITSLFIDNSNNLWIGTSLGLSRYNYKTNTFINFLFDENGHRMRVLRFVEWRKGDFIVASDIGLFRFSEKKGFQKLNFPKMSFVNSSMLEIDNCLLVGADKGLFFYFPQSDTYRLANSSFSEKSVLTILPENLEKKRIWVGTEGSGLFKFDITNNVVKRYRHNKNNPKSISSDYIRSLCYDNQYRLWIGTFVGLNIFDETKEEFTRYYNSFYNEGSISQNSIRSLFCDQQGGMWCGTYFGGLNYYHPLKHQFEHVRHIKGENSLNDNVVSCMLVEPSGKIWIGTNDNGLNRYDPASGQFEFYRSEEHNSSSLSGNNVKSLCRTKNGNLYVGTHGGGLDYFDVSAHRFKRIHLTDRVDDNNVYSILKDRNQKLWVGTLNGLAVYDEKTGNSSLVNQKLLYNKKIFCLFSDTKNRMWTGTDDGVGYFTSDRKYYRSVKFAVRHKVLKTVYCFCEQKSGNLWIGTQEGLYLFDEKSHSVVSCKDNSGFPDYSIFGILEDSFNRLWISTNRGLICYSTDSDTWRIYTEQDGMQSNQFNVYSYCKSDNGRMYFGGINGITAFYPERLIDNPYTPRVIIDNLTVYNKTVVPGDKTGTLTYNISLTQKLILKPNYLQFGLEFVVPNYLSGQDNTFAYKLDGFEKDWVFTKQNSVSYSNLEPGEYTFRIRASNNDGKWSEETTDLKILVLPVWWKSWWARLVFIAGVVSFLWFIFHIYTMRQAMKRELTIERLEKEKNEELNEMKIRFFINISHEFRTPLTLMISPLQEILDRCMTDKWIRDQVMYVQRNSRRLLHLINEVLDYRKAEQGQYELKTKCVEITAYVHELYELFGKLALQKKINYSFESTVGDKTVRFDPEFVERIVTNLLSNAFKNTPENGFIDVLVRNFDNHLILSVTDTGCGIPREKQKLIFERFYQVDEHVKGTGIGLSLVKKLVEIHHGYIELDSDPGKGSTFRVILPSSDEAYTATEKADNRPTVIDLHEAMLSDLWKPEDLPETLPLGLTETTELDKSIKRTLLLVEDDEEIANYLELKLSFDFHILRAFNGKQALDLVASHPGVDIIVSDIMMPEMDGIRFCKAMKQNIRTCHIPIVLLTAKAGVEDELTGLSFGADDYISKPFVFSILKARLVNILKARQRVLQFYSSSVTIDPEKITFNAMDEELLRKAINIVEKNLENSAFSADDFSAGMNMSRSNLHLKLKALTGESAIEFIRRIRFSHACELLKDGRYSVAEISTMVGFGSPSYFATSFKKYMGCLPTEYLKKR